MKIPVPQQAYKFTAKKVELHIQIETRIVLPYHSMTIMTFVSLQLSYGDIAIILL